MVNPDRRMPIIINYYSSNWHVNVMQLLGLTIILKLFISGYMWALNVGVL